MNKDYLDELASLSAQEVYNQLEGFYFQHRLVIDKFPSIKQQFESWLDKEHFNLQGAKRALEVAEYKISKLIELNRTITGNKSRILPQLQVEWKSNCSLISTEMLLDEVEVYLTSLCLIVDRNILLEKEIAKEKETARLAEEQRKLALERERKRQLELKRQEREAEENKRKEQKRLEQEEQYAFKEACRLNSIAAYSRFEQKYRKSKFLYDIQSRKLVLLKAEEQAYYQQACQEDSIKAYKQFLNKYKTSQYREDIRRRKLFKEKEVKLFEEVEFAEGEAYEELFYFYAFYAAIKKADSFLENYPSSKYYSEVKKIKTKNLWRVSRDITIILLLLALALAIIWGIIIFLCWFIDLF